MKPGHATVQSPFELERGQVAALLGMMKEHYLEVHDAALQG
jgi:hypothetical protein